MRSLRGSARPKKAVVNTDGEEDAVPGTRSSAVRYPNPWYPKRCKHLADGGTRTHPGACGVFCLYASLYASLSTCAGG